MTQTEKTRNKEQIAGRVLIGMLTGVIVGLLLMFFEPVPIQPKDVLKATLENGETAMITVGGKDDPAVATVADLTFELESLAGVKPGPAREIIGRTLGEPVTKMEIDERSTVSIRAPLTEAAYIIGQIFLRLLRMLVIPLIASTVLIGIASLADLKRLGSLGAQTIGVYFSTMFLAVLIGMAFVYIIGPGRDMKVPAPEAETVTLQENPSVAELMLRIIPNNPVEAIANFDILGMLFFVIMLGIAMLRLGKRRAAPVFNFFESLGDLVMVLIRWVMRLAPYGVGGLIAYYIGVQSPEHLGPLASSLGMYAITVASSLVVHFLALILIVALVARYNPITFLKHATPAMTTAFGTSSSAATMPITLASTKKLGVSKRISGFTIPVGATMNMDGTALFEAVAVIFFAQWYGIELTFMQQVIVGLTAVLAAVGAAGIPSAGLVTMTIVLTAVGLPAAGVGLLFAIDRPLDMMRTVVNVTGDMMTSRVVQTWNPDIRQDEDDKYSEYEPIDPEASHDAENDN